MAVSRDLCGVSSSSEPAAHEENNTHRSSPRDAPLFHFGLRQLFWFVAIVCALLTVLSLTQGLTSAVLLLATLAVAAHLFATALGSRLRQRADTQQGWGQPRWRATSAEVAAERSARLAAVRLAPRSPWHNRGGTDLRWLPRLIVAASIVGGVAGVILLRFTAHQGTSFAGVVVGAFSLAVLCAWGAFLCGSFYGVFRHGFREALAEQKKDEATHSRRT
jgi:hypothetical protein